MSAMVWVLAKRQLLDFTMYHILGICISYHRLMRYLGVDKFNVEARRRRMEIIWHLYCMRTMTTQHRVMKSLSMLGLASGTSSSLISKLGDEMRRVGR